MKNGYLVLESGETYSGVWGGGEERAGEVVFNTSHSGYEEIATDPSYFSQIVLMTSPMQGNYGVSKDFWESKRLWIEGFIAMQVLPDLGNGSWRGRLKETAIPLLTDLDTRQIVKRLRSGGTPWGGLVHAETKEEAKKKALALIEKKKSQELDWVHLVSRKDIEKRVGESPKGPRFGVLDFGCKENILRELSQRCQELIIFPSRTPAAEILSFKIDALMLTNGPGDPGDVKVSTETTRNLLGHLPIFGICMGHQILGLALGAKTFKLKFGHRGSNHPIKDKVLNKVYMSSQNHGYAVDEATLPKDVRVTHYNLNDKTVAGFLSEQKGCMGIQFHPESHPGPHESAELFDYFIGTVMKGFKK